MADTLLDRTLTFFHGDEAEANFTNEVLRSLSSLLDREPTAFVTVALPQLPATSSPRQEGGLYSAQGYSTDSIPQTLGDTLFTASDATELLSLFSTTSAERHDHGIPIRVASFTSLPRTFRDQAIIIGEDEIEDDRLYANWQKHTLEHPSDSEHRWGKSHLPQVR